MNDIAQPVPSLDPQTQAGQPDPETDAFDELDRPRRPWWILWVLLAVGLVAGGVVYFRTHRTRPRPRFVTAHVTMGDITETVEATGTIQPLLQVQVGSQVSGRISSVPVDFNSLVHRGDLVAQIDPVPLQAQVAASRAALLSAEATLAHSRADLELAERNLRRAQDLRTRGLNAPSDLDAAEGARDAARAQLRVGEAEISRARAQLDTAQTNLGYANIYAPIDGIVITRSVDPGQTVAASFTTPNMFVIANDLTQMRVLADVDEADIGKLHEPSPGEPEPMHADVRVDAFPGDPFPGIVFRLRNSPTNTQGVVTYTTEINVPNPDRRLRPGMTATVSVVSAVHRNVMRVPNAALRFQPGRYATPPGGAGGPGGNRPPEPPPTRAPETPLGPHQGRVYVLRHDHPVPVVVTTSISDGRFTQIESPQLHDGTEIITDETDAATPAGPQRRMF